MQQFLRRISGRPSTSDQQSSKQQNAHRARDSARHEITPLLESQLGSTSSRGPQGGILRRRRLPAVPVAVRAAVRAVASAPGRTIDDIATRPEAAPAPVRRGHIETTMAHYLEPWAHHDFVLRDPLIQQVQAGYQPPDPLDETNPWAANYEDMARIDANDQLGLDLIIRAAYLAAVHEEPALRLRDADQYPQFLVIERALDGGPPSTDLLRDRVAAFQARWESQPPAR